MSFVPVTDGVPETARYKRICDEYEKVYGKKPSYVVRASGRVNLIGEHIDYCGYAVLPIAIEQDVVMAVSRNSDARLRFNNIDPQYQPVDLDCLSSLDVDKVNPKWQHYVICGYRGIIEHCQEMSKHCGGVGEHCGGGKELLEGGVGLDILVHGTIPRSAGLSSSSALVCAAALATMYAVVGTKKQMDKTEMAEICQHCERYIGTEGGGMDQSISFLAQKGTAKLIEFNPIRATDVVLPDEAVFVISNTCSEVNKAATDYFNVRVAECRLATQILAKLNNVDGSQVKRLGDLPPKLGVTLNKMIEIVERTLHAEPYNKEEICKLLGLTVPQLDETWLSERSRSSTVFKLRDRALHVYGEADRVLEFKAVCDRKETGALESLGRLMHESHVSCRDLYQCSCPELDRLVDLAMASGALGSRLTGAGWGGCAVSLVPAAKLEEFLKKVRQGYYEGSEALISRVNENLFATQPGSGAAVYLVQK